MHPWTKQERAPHVGRKGCLVCLRMLMHVQVISRAPGARRMARWNEGNYSSKSLLVLVLPKTKPQSWPAILLKRINGSDYFAARSISLRGTRGQERARS